MNRRVEHDVVQLARVEEAMTAHRRVPRGDAIERPAGEIGRKDDVDDVATDEGAPRGDRVDHGDRPLERQLFADSHLLLQLTPQGLDEAFAAVDAAAGEEPVLPTTRLL